VGPIQRRALIGLLSFSLDAGSPFLSLHGGVDLLDVLRLGARVDLIEDSALRVAAETTWTWLELDRAGFDLEVYAGRAFGLEAVSTWDAGLLLQGRLTLDDRMTAALRGGVPDRARGNHRVEALLRPLG
jgi:hypothetical protein